MTVTGFIITISYEQEFTFDELWVNGDKPEQPTTDDVLALIRKCGGPARIVEDWNFEAGDVVMAVTSAYQ